MSSKKMNSKPSIGFSPDDKSLGGAYSILTDYANYYRKLENVQPTRAILDTRKTAGRTEAQRISTNRAARLATTDMSVMEHSRIIYHMNRRIEESYSSTERKKNQFDVSIYPAYQKRGSNLYKSTMHAAMLAWSTQDKSTRPATAPSQRSADEQSGSVFNIRGRGEGYRGFSVTTGLRDAYPSDDFPLQQTAREFARDSTYVAYKRAIMAEIIESRMFREKDLKQLFQSYKKLAPLRDKDTVDRVVQELKFELDVGKS
ncbi:hypothetical protein CEUSTIGMA_g6924.t1 [Chlamydomonas eustigma]|uniref:Uncharacterized protein n=1 Tax=Chlamydomonas eustigma TaxID=1157962 RepID=A0A250X8T3_9CHLO|nr:hypothetical protein CEUSTIGMA_g6924.t1 [Chlamydomonas eustigma]|eukprot:GAX79483.1 hypothetical protein CEUSTIGMA_g6924.t1 [Chlamydomonas eustigma]